MTTPTEAILAEANLPSIETRATKLSVIALEKSLRCEPSNPRHKTAIKHITQRTKKLSWRTKAKRVWERIFGEETPDTKPGRLPPWLDLSNPKFESPFKRN